MRVRSISTTLIATVLLNLAACSESSASKGGPDGLGDFPPTVLFDLKSAKGGDLHAESQFYDCTYQAGGKSAKFGLQFHQQGPLRHGNFPLALAEGKFLSVAGSDNSTLLQDLKKALAATEVPIHPSRVAELAFTAAVLEEKQSRDPSGGYSSNPPGDWTRIKIFLPKGGDKGEVFLYLNPVLGKGEFSVKDVGYGNYLLRQFAQVF